MSGNWSGQLARRIDRGIFCENREIKLTEHPFCNIIDYNRQGGDFMYTALDMAKYIIDKCTKDRSPISNLQLQKILYYIQKEFLRHGTQAFSEEIEAWQFGPVVPEVYKRYCGFGALPIRMQYEVVIQPDDRYIIDAIVEKKRVLNPWDMVSDTHSSGKAWDLIYRGGAGDHQVIPQELIASKG